MAAYSLILKNNRTNYHEGVAVDVHRDGVPVDASYEAVVTATHVVEPELFTYSRVLDELPSVRR